MERLMLVLFCLALPLDTFPVQAQSLQRQKACNVAGTNNDFSDVCVCNPTNVRCVQLSPKLVVVPEALMPKSTALEISGSAISRIDEFDFLGLEDLEQLFLQDNDISYIHPKAFKNMYKLRELQLCGNSLKDLDPSGFTFQHLPSLVTLSLQRNQIQTINKYSFLTVVTSSAVNVQLANNKVICDCDVLALRDWQKVAPGSNLKLNGLMCPNDVNSLNRPYQNVDKTVFGACDDVEERIRETDVKERKEKEEKDKEDKSSNENDARGTEIDDSNDGKDNPTSLLGLLRINKTEVSSNSNETALSRKRRQGRGSNNGNGRGSDDEEGSGQGPGSNSGNGQGPGSNNGNGQGPGSNNGNGQGPGSNNGNGQGPGSNNGDGQKPGSNNGNGQSPGSNNGNGQGPNSGDEEESNDNNGEEPGFDGQGGSNDNNGEEPGFDGEEGSGQGPGSNNGNGQGPGSNNGNGQGPGSNNGNGQGPGLNNGNGQGPGSNNGNGQGPGSNNGNGQGPGSNNGNGQGPGSNNGDGQGPGSNNGNGQSPGSNNGNGQGPNSGDEEESNDNNGEEPGFDGQGGSNDNNGSEEPGSDGERQSNNNNGEEPDFDGEGESNNNNGEEPGFDGEGGSNDNNGEEPGFDGEGESNESNGEEPGFDGEGESNDNNGEEPGFDGEEESDEDSVASTVGISNTMVSCRLCNGQRTNHGCNQQREEPCPGKNMVCRRTVAWNETRKTISISSQCDTYSQCLQSESRNRNSCGIGYRSNGDVECEFCCLGPTCMDDTVGGRTVDFTFFLTYLRNQEFDENYMDDPANPQFLAQEGRLDKLFQNVITSVKGGMDVYVQKYERHSAGKHKVVLRLEFTAFSTETADLLSNTVKRDIERDSNDGEGFLTGENIDRTSYVLNVTVVGQPKCGPIRTSDPDKGTIEWEAANAGMLMYAVCPYQNPNAVNLAYAKLKCEIRPDEIVAWGVADYSDCPTKDESQELPDLEDVVNRPVTPESAQTVSALMLSYTGDPSTVTPKRLNNVVFVLEKLIDQEMLEKPDVVQNVMKCVNNLMDVSDETLRASETESSTSKRLLGIIDSVPERAPLVNDKLKVVTGNLAVVAQAINDRETRDLTLSADIGSDSNNHLDDAMVDVSYAKRGPQRPGDTTMVIPTGALIRSLSSADKNKLKRVTFAVHSSDKLFSSMQDKEKVMTIVTTTPRPQDSVMLNDDEDDDSEENEDSQLVLVRMVNSMVVTANVPGVKVQGLSDNITITFSHSAANASNADCVFWDETMHKGKGGWSGEGCGIVKSDDGETTCGCNHLTNFALLMDVYREGSGLSDLDRKVLSIISYVGCGISLLALVLTLLTYSLFRKLRRDNPSKILINLCLALLMSNLVYLVGMHDYSFDNSAACKTVAILLHYFLLAALTWMAVEAFYMYLALVLVFKTYFTNFLLKCCLVGWGVPLVIVVITLAIDAPNNYGFINSGMCWLKNPAFYAAFVGPVCLILLLNCIAFGLVVKQLVSMSSSKLNKTDRNSTIQKLRGAVGVVILLGLSWLFGIFAIDQASVVFYYLFAIFNSLQGFFIFIFYCLLKKDAIAAWKRALPCFEEYGDTTKTSSNSRGQAPVVSEPPAASATAAAHLVKHNVNDSSSSNLDNGHTKSTSISTSDSRKDSYYYSINSNKTDSTLDDGETVEADPSSGKVNYAAVSSPTSATPPTPYQKPSSPSQGPNGHPVYSLALINPAMQDDEHLYVNNKDQHSYVNNIQMEASEKPDSLANPESPSNTSKPNRPPPVAAKPNSLDLDQIKLSTVVNIESPKNKGSSPSSPPYLSDSKFSPSSPRAEGEIDYSRPARVNDLRLKYERTSSETSDKEITNT